MGFYAVSTITLTRPETDKKKLFYVDDGSGGGKLEGLAEWWREPKEDAPILGYFPNPPMSWLITKPQFYNQAQELFLDVNVTVEGHAVLALSLGTVRVWRSLCRRK